jgi:Spy/CpxP family protein refolding chaperone
MKKTLITLIALALMLPVAVSAQGGPRDGSGPFCGDNPRMMGGPQCGMHGGGQHMMGGGPGGMMGHPGMGMMMKFADELGLNDQQRAQIKKMTTDFQMERIDLEANLEKAQVQLRSARRDDASQADFDKAVDRVSGLRADMQKMHYRHRTAMKNVLTAEQQAKLKELRKDAWDDDDAFPGRGMRGKRGGGQGQGDGRGQGGGQGGGWGNP